jgi:hypothetical protein
MGLASPAAIYATGGRFTMRDLPDVTAKSEMSA